MDVFKNVLNSISSGVHTSVQTVSNVLPGNALIREYNIENHVSSGGIGK